ncbi:hypothetical protein AB434_2370 [Heyndrickxia coagulans]|uniref:Uncharacterized protein n=1 Tax=Heyndrickxia coagulans TaxID=1398 RepID=A0AAN0T689_HEYCO|nr:hypothetical protein SB48_HM08orf04683 [Heyndrickxia coagulans]AKN54775.1 hypothetical protein AB434_2370 [Heyndrickxia coagulans]KYC71749.1 hypothetical protein B4096_0274 [Heyndrickxia coagulans]
MNLPIICYFCLIVCFGDKERNRGFHSILAQMDKAGKNVLLYATIRLFQKYANE